MKTIIYILLALGIVVSYKPVHGNGPTLDHQDGTSFIVSVKPNTVADQVMVHVSNIQDAVGGVRTLQLLDINGHVVENLLPRLQKNAAQQDIDVNCSEWSNGMYLLVVSDDQNSGTLKIIKMR